MRCVNGLTDSCGIVDMMHVEMELMEQIKQKEESLETATVRIHYFKVGASSSMVAAISDVRRGHVRIW